MRQPLLDHPALFCHPELTRLGDKKLAPYAILRKSVHRYVGSRTVIDDHDRLIFVYRCNCRRDHVGQMDTENVRGRVYTGAIGLALTIPSLLLLGFGHNFLMIVGGGLCFGIGFGIFDANNMPILCQFISPRYRATAYGIMNMTGVFAGAAITDLLGRSTDAGNLGHDFAMLAGIVALSATICKACLKTGVSLDNLFLNASSSASIGGKL